MHELHCYDYVNQPYGVVRDAVLADPQILFRMSTTSNQAIKLHARIGAVEVGAEIGIEIERIDEKCEPFERPRTTLGLSWRAKRGSSLFPLMVANLEIYPLTPTETQIELSGKYDPPLGFVGEAIDAVAFHRFAATSVATFMREIATYLRKALAPQAVSA